MLRSLLMATGLLLSGGLGSELRQDGYAFQPPEGFRMERMEPYGGSRVGAVAGSAATTGALSAALVEGQGEQAAVLLVAVVEEGLTASPSARDDFGAAVVRHLGGELGLALVVERVELREGRVEVLGTVREEGRVRTVWVAGLPSEGRHAVVTVSAPAERWEALEPRVRQSLGTFRLESRHAGPLTRGLAGALAGALGGALGVSYVAWRRRASARQGGITNLLV